MMRKTRLQTNWYLIYHKTKRAREVFSTVSSKIESQNFMFQPPSYNYGLHAGTDASILLDQLGSMTQIISFIINW